MILVFSSGNALGQLPRLPNERPFPDYVSNYEKTAAAATKCGPMSLVAAARSVGIFLSDATEKDLSLASQRGCSMSTLSVLAKEIGFYAVGVEADSNQLHEWVNQYKNGPAIVFLDHSAYATILAAEGDDFAIKSPNESPRIIIRSALDKRRDGVHATLFLSRNPIGLAFNQSNVSVDGLAIDPSVVSLGVVHTSRWRGSAWLNNNSQKPVKIHQVLPSCSCFKATVGSFLIAPGCRTELMVFGTDDTKSGEVRHSVAIVSDLGKTVVPVRGFMSPPAVLSMPSATLRCKVGMSCSAVVPLHITDPANTVSMQSSLSALHAALTDKSIRLTWEPSNEIGWHRAVVRIFREGDDEKNWIELQIGVLVESVNSVSPASALIMCDSETWERRFLLDVDASIDTGMVKHQWSDPRIAEYVSCKGVVVSPSQVEFTVTAKSGTVKSMYDMNADGFSLSLLNGNNLLSEVEFLFFSPTLRK